MEAAGGRCSLPPGVRGPPLPAASVPFTMPAVPPPPGAKAPPPPHLRLQLSVKTGIPEGTSGQICNEIALNPVFQPQLDTAIVSGKKTLQR